MIKTFLNLFIFISFLFSQTNHNDSLIPINFSHEIKGFCEGKYNKNNGTIFFDNDTKYFSNIKFNVFEDRIDVLCDSVLMSSCECESRKIKNLKDSLILLPSDNIIKIDKIGNDRGRIYSNQLDYTEILPTRTFFDIVNESIYDIYEVEIKIDYFSRINDNLLTSKTYSFKHYVEDFNLSTLDNLFKMSRCFEPNDNNKTYGYLCDGDKFQPLKHQQFSSKGYILPKNLYPDQYQYIMINDIKYYGKVISR